MPTGIRRSSASSGNRPREGLSPTIPLQAAGIRIEPPPSLAWAIGTTPAATNAPEPEDEAPAVGSVSHGLRTGPSRGCSADALNPNSDSCVLPTDVGPVARNTRVNSPSATAFWGVHASVPRIVGWPATSTLSLTNVGTPLKKPLPAVAVAADRACSNAAYAKALRAGSTASVRAMAASMTSALPTEPARMASARPTASRSPRASSPKACTRRMAPTLAAGAFRLGLAHLEANEPRHRHTGLVEQRLDRLLVIGHRRLLEQHGVLEEAVQPALDDLGQRLLRLALGLRGLLGEAPLACSTVF